MLQFDHACQSQAKTEHERKRPETKKKRFLEENWKRKNDMKKKQEFSKTYALNKKSKKRDYMV